MSGGVRRVRLFHFQIWMTVTFVMPKRFVLITDPQRSLANNSAVYTEKPSAQEFLAEWTALVQAGTGERGIFNRVV